MSPVLAAELRPLPVAPRAFDAEVLGGWIGRLAAPDRMTVPKSLTGTDLMFRPKVGRAGLRPTSASKLICTNLVQIIHPNFILNQILYPAKVPNTTHPTHLKRSAFQSFSRHWSQKI